MKQQFVAGEAAIAVKRWFHRCPDDLDGLTFVEFVPEEPPSEQEFINSFDMDDVALSRMAVSSFATGGSAAAGLQPAMEQINRALLTFRFILVGGDSWQNGEGTGAIREGIGRVSRLTT